MVSFAQGGTGVPFPPFLSSWRHFLQSARSTYGGWWWWAGVCMGVGCRQGWVGNVIPGVLT